MGAYNLISKSITRSLIILFWTKKQTLNLIKTYISTFLSKSHLQSKPLFTLSASIKRYQIKFQNNKLFTSVIHCHCNYKQTTLLRSVYLNSYKSIDFSCIFKLGFSFLQKVLPKFSSSGYNFWIIFELFKNIVFLHFYSLVH